MYSKYSTLALTHAINHLVGYCSKSFQINWRATFSSSYILRVWLVLLVKIKYSTPAMVV